MSGGPVSGGPVSAGPVSEGPDGGRPVLLRASALVGLPVVTVSGGEDVAEVRDVVYSAEQGRVLGFTLNKRGFLSGRMRSVIPAETVAGIGTDAVMIPDDGCCLLGTDAAPDGLGAPDASRNVIGNAVMTDGGVRLGHVVDVILHRGRGVRVVGYEIRADEGPATRFLPLGCQQAVSGEVLVVSASAESLLVDELDSLAASP